MAYTPFDSAVPGADLYGQADVVATNAYNKALAQVNQNRLNTLTSYGYLGDINPATGVVGNIRVDPNNLYGQLQSLFHNQALEDRNATFATEDRGIHGGLANQAASELKFQHGAQRTALGQSLASTLSDLQGQQNEAAYTRDSALYEAELQQLQAAIAAGLFNPPNDGGDGAGGAPPSSDGSGAAGANIPYTDATSGSNRNGSSGPNNAGLTSGAVNPYGSSAAKKKAIKTILSGGGGARMLKL